MADAFTTYNNLVKPEYNANEDTWGTLLNTIPDAIDAQITGSIYGLTLSTAGDSATFGIAAGGASGMVLASAYTKTTSAWSLGSGGGALDAGSIAANTWYHAYEIQRVDTGVVDILISTNATTPAMPANYTRKRRIGAMRTDASSHWLAFTQLGNMFLWATPITNYNNVTADGTATLLTVSTPPGINTEAILSCGCAWVSGFAQIFNFYSPYASTGTIVYVDSDVKYAYPTVRIITDTSSRIYEKCAPGSNYGTYTVLTYGWIDPRGSW